MLKIYMKNYLLQNILQKQGEKEGLLLLHQQEKVNIGDRRWIDVEDPELLNYENTQVLLIGARKKDVEEELGIDIDEQKETEKSADMFKELKIRKEQVPLKPLFEGKFPQKEEIPMAQEVKQLSKEEAPGEIR